tara:strand:- start:7384 stop:8055 length:672 start_codon:yes stop_codon:yes gene_type:complete
MKLLGVAGSNVAYIGMVINKLPITKTLTYHGQYYDSKRNKTPRFGYIHDMASQDRDIKIAFDFWQELPVINWHVKFRLHPQTNYDARVGERWNRQQKPLWNAYDDLWESRSILRWTSTWLNDPYMKSNADNIGKIFHGTCLYEGYESARAEFKKFDIDYTKDSYDSWRESQNVVLEYWQQVKDAVNVEKARKLGTQTLTGVALGMIASKNKITEDEVWETYLK